MPPTQPHSREAEEGLVGCILIAPELFPEMSALVKASDFYIKRLSWIWETFETLRKESIDIDLITVTNQLAKTGVLEEVGGMAFLTSLLNQVPSTLNAGSYAHIVEDDSVRRKMLVAAGKIAEMVYDEANLDEVISRSENILHAATNDAIKGDIRHVSELMEKSEPQQFISTGMRDIDHFLREGGWASGELNLLAGRPGEGKTAMLINMAISSSLVQRKHTAFFSLEMRDSLIISRMLSRLTKIDSDLIDRNAVPDRDMEKLEKARDLLANAPLYIDDTPSMRPSQISARCRSLRNKAGLDIVFIDYIQLLSADSRSDVREQQVASLSRDLKRSARELDIPFVGAAQLSRAVEQRASREPFLSDLRESGALEQDSDTVSFLWRENASASFEGKDAFVVAYKVAKDRNGKIGKVTMLHRPDIHIFVPAVKS